jgi:lysophospholipase L1-like esterase
MHGTANDIFFLFGDSITQQGYNQARGLGWVAALHDVYIRRLNVLNAGLSGYNTEMALLVLPRILPPISQGRIRIMTVFFGANDARLPDTMQAQQHVPIDQYRENLRTIVRHPSVREHNPRIILITPPPIDERMCETANLQSGNDQVRRAAEVTMAYANVVREIGKELDTETLDLWNIFMENAGWKSGEPLIGAKTVEQNIEKGLPTLLLDGLHLTPDGNKLVYESLMRTIRNKWPDQAPEALPYVLPTWANTEAWKT